MTAKLHAVSQEMQRRRHQSIPEQGRWLQRGGARARQGLPAFLLTVHAIAAFRTQVARRSAPLARATR